MAQHWDRDPDTGDYVMENGSPKQTDSLTIPAYHRLRTKRGTWLYAPNTRFGSNFHTVRKNRSSSDPTLYEELAVNALSPMVEDGRASEVESTVQRTARQGVALRTVITPEIGEPEELVFNPIGT